MAVDISGLSASERRDLGEEQRAAMAYVWGREDAGERDLPVNAAYEFGEAWTTRKRAFITQETHFMPSLRDGFKEWCETGRIHTRNARCGHGEWVATCRKEHGEIEGSLTKAEIEENARARMTVRPWVTAHLQD